MNFSSIRQTLNTRRLNYISKLNDIELKEIISFHDLANDNYINNNFEVLTYINEKLKLQTPIAYLLPYIEVNGIKLNLPNGKVLIPRIETEELCELVVNQINKSTYKNFTALDIGTGSGFIALWIKKYCKNVDITAIDISKDAIDAAKSNSNLNKLDIKFVHKSIQNFQPVNKFDLIISNPPYIPSSIKSKIAKSVKNHEPEIALFANNNGTEIINEIIAFAKKYLKPNGKMFMEINSKKQALEVCKKNNIKDFSIKKDIFGKYRFIVLQYASIE